MGSDLLDIVWVLCAACSVFAMQAGFLCLESGVTRSKNAVNVAVKNISDFSASMLLYWAIGFAFMFGMSAGGFIGLSQFFVPVGANDPGQAALFFFQAMFCATAVTIVSGAVAERMRLGAYIIVTLIVSGLIYPVFGHWVWGGLLTGEPGWLQKLGFIDFAGGTVVHVIGGCAALAASATIGPRLSRFKKGGYKTSSADNLPLAMVGALLLMQGWFGFNGGSTLGINPEVPGIICNTVLSGTAGMITALAVSWIVKKYVDVFWIINGLLAGLVAITSGCHAVSAGEGRSDWSNWVCRHAPCRPAFGATEKSTTPLARSRCTLGAGIWGALSVGLLGDLSVLDTGLTRWAQVGVQFTGTAVAVLVSFGGLYLLLNVIARFYALRVSEDAEVRGLNISEHGVTTTAFELLSEMESQRQSGDFTQPVSVEPFSEVGEIAVQYNRVLGAVNEKSRELMSAKRELETTVEELEEFNQHMIGRELRMIELKSEVNELSELVGQEPPYVQDVAAIESLENSAGAGAAAAVEPH